MPKNHIVLVAGVYDQADIVRDFVEWYWHLGIDFALVVDFGSVDGTQAVLDDLARSGRLEWFVLPERDVTKYRPADVLTATARDRHGAEWIVQCDADEFLCPLDGDLVTKLAAAAREEFTVVNVPGFNMTGLPLEPGQSATRALNLRVDRPVLTTTAQHLSGELPVPFVFTTFPHKTIVRASAFTGYGPGAHAATSSWGRSGEIEGLRFLHYPFRGFETFRQKIGNTAAWLADNPQLEPWWGWHWRRWIRLEREGRLREDYESQFVSPARGEQLIREGTCVVDETVLRWCRAGRRG